MNIVNVDEFARMYFGLTGPERPTKAQRNTISTMARDRVIPAAKIGKRWFIDLDRLEEAFDARLPDAAAKAEE